MDVPLSATEEQILEWIVEGNNGLEVPDLTHSRRVPACLVLLSHPWPGLCASIHAMPVAMFS